jgi:hypothetical protein
MHPEGDALQVTVVILFKHGDRVGILDEQGNCQHTIPKRITSQCGFIAGGPSLLKGTNRFVDPLGHFPLGHFPRLKLLGVKPEAVDQPFTIKGVMLACLHHWLLTYFFRIDVDE